MRGSCVMPAGLGKKIVVAVNCEPHMHDRVKEAGADIIVTNETKNQAKFLIFPCFLTKVNKFRSKKPLSHSINSSALMEA